MKEFEYNYVFPFCIYHYINKSTNTFLSFLRKGYKYKKDTKMYVKCLDSPDKWYFAGQFYAIDPSIIPKPRGLQIFAVKQRNNFIQSISIVTDIFHKAYEETQNTLYFSAWTMPVPNTSPLYLHGSDDNIFLSYDYDPPPEDKMDIVLRKGFNDEIGSIKSQKNKDLSFYNTLDFTQNVFSPIYVLSNKVFKDGFENIKFQCIDGNIIPYNGKIPHLFSYYTPSDPLSLPEAIVKCNELDIDKGTPLTLEKIVRLLSKDTNHLSKATNTNNNNTYLIICILCVIAIIVGIIICIIIWKKR